MRKWKSTIFFIYVGFVVLEVKNLFATLGLSLLMGTENYLVPQKRINNMRNKFDKILKV